MPRRPLKTVAIPKPKAYKPKTARVDDTLDKALAGENVEGLLKSLGAEEKALFYELLELVRSGQNVDLSALWKVDFVRNPPTMEEFVEDPYWFGDVLKRTEENQGLFPVWKEALIKDFNLDSRIHNLVITGSLGTGKSFTMSVIFAYRMALASLLRNPQSFFGLSRGSKIFYVMLSITKSVVTETVFGTVQDFMSRSPYFLEELKFNPDLKYSDFRIPMGRDIFLTAGSKGWHVIGRNTMGVCLDEGNFRLEANPDVRAYQLYDEVRTRIQNRFQKVSGFLPAICILSSSARDESSFTEQVIKDIESSKEDHTQLVYRYSVYQVKRHELKLADKWFKVCYGLRNIDPTLLSGWYKEDGTYIEDPQFPREEPPAGAKTELVPADYFDAFKRNVKTNLQSICGISTGGSHRLFSSTVDIERCIEMGEASGVVNPAISGAMSFPISDEDNRQVWDYLEHPKFLTRVQSRVVPLRHPDAVRYAHVDLATQNQAGVAVCHLVGYQDVKGLVKEGEVFSERRLIVEYDFILSIIAGRAKPISLEKIQKFFFWLKDICNYRFGLVTADQFQSEMPLQMMEKGGFKVAKQSVDKTKDAYYAWRTGFEELRIRLYRQEIMLREAEHLIDLDKKIDHPQNLSKDLCDSASASYLSAIDNHAVSVMAGSSSPGVFTDTDLDAAREKPPIEIPIISAQRVVKVFQA